MTHRHSHKDTEHNILIALILNIVFSAAEFIGGLITGSIAILTDALHDFGDALSIGVSYLLERKSRHRPDAKHTYGYARYSTLGALFTTTVLLVGSGVVLVLSLGRLLDPIEVNYDGMLIFAIFAVIINGAAAYITRDKSSANQHAVNIHMLEDTLGWVVILVGSVIIKITGWHIIDPIMSLGVAAFIIVVAFRNLRPISDVFLEKVPNGISVSHIKSCVEQLDSVVSVHHLHVWAAAENRVYVTMHVVIQNSASPAEVKSTIRAVLKAENISHSVLELESESETCIDPTHHA